MIGDLKTFILDNLYPSPVHESTKSNHRTVLEDPDYTGDKQISTDRLMQLIMYFKAEPRLPIDSPRYRRDKAVRLGLGPRWKAILKAINYCYLSARL